MRRARSQGYRSRAAFKLLEINSRDRLLIPGALVADLGAAPGGWSQVAAGKVGSRGRVFAVDLLEIAPISGVTILRGDFRDPSMRAKLAGEIGARKLDVVLSDLSPNLTGIAAVDQARAAELARAAAAFCRSHLSAGGAFLCKLFQGGEFGALLGEMKEIFSKVEIRKPAASRGESRETYLLARGLKGIQ
ncbi:MAG: RlmE family RNA methyltransferase [Pseudomonadota bacterium]